jgi:hypothetical protein
MVTDAFTKKFVMDVVRKAREINKVSPWIGEQQHNKKIGYENACRDILEALDYELTVDK